MGDLKNYKKLISHFLHTNISQNFNAVVKLVCQIYEYYYAQVVN